MAERCSEEGLIPAGDQASEPAEPAVDRRAWLSRAAGAVVAWAGLTTAAPASASDDARSPSAGADEADAEIRRAEALARRVTDHPIRSVRSPHFQAIGDASESFFKLSLLDCEQIALDYRTHFRAKGFDVQLPDRRLTLIAFRDERPFLRFADRVPPGTTGFYSRPENWLALFDFRNVPMNPRAAGQSNLETLTHEATHQLTFNTGLLDRQADIPLCIVEGLAMYSERRRLTGSTEPGQLNLRRLEELAHVQRRIAWIPASDLLADDRSWYARDEDNRILGYAESWLLVYHLMSDAVRLPQLREYLAALRGRREKAQRVDDAKAHFGDLGQLDRELRQASIHLQRPR